MIECKNISLSFEDHLVFKDFNLKIEKGESVCISGDSGKGKSTLLKLMQGFELIDEGSIVIDDIQQSESTIQTIRNKITWIPQNINLPVKNGIELMELLHVEDEKEQVYGFLKQLGVDENNFIKDFTEISGGQKQRIIIAICLSLDNEIILMDEPTSSLDENSIQLLIQLIQNLKRKTIVSASHNASWLKSVDRVISLG
ncbi:ABC transporter ATP-binding protein [Labilibacter marinus]|uniref:ABC transporter ATP-binding protein n=1 Tax=Labilibacter marinus TaxID=1477105 RepID=UPI00094F9F7D|nr:ATP-binding cassette domain-containing protein [Labilibacter marinus]